MKNKKYKKTAVIQNDNFADVFVPDTQFDFHGLGPLTTYDIEDYLLKFIENSYHSGCDTVLIITGKGQKVRPLVQKLLSSSTLVRKFKSAGYYNGQDGAYEVWLKNEQA